MRSNTNDFLREILLKITVSPRLCFATSTTVVAHFKYFASHLMLSTCEQPLCTFLIPLYGIRYTVKVNPDFKWNSRAIINVICRKPWSISQTNKMQVVVWITLYVYAITSPEIDNFWVFVSHAKNWKSEFVLNRHYFTC